MYRGVPHPTEYELIVRIVPNMPLSFLANLKFSWIESPKSPSFTTIFVLLCFLLHKNIFSGFKSLWIMLKSWTCLSPFKIYLKIIKFYFLSILFLFPINYFKVSPSQYSIYINRSIFKNKSSFFSLRYTSSPELLVNSSNLSGPIRCSSLLSIKENPN